ncbi:hypothetical protein GSI_04115 [Ganoderma sinense ZZ0214-1]|uniref:Uncharacterized protein n=1 Tax=Ganoderma sinense ZZ0214-1 TaxID=1077348 RepID=A0A2G8SIA6_9APHY|nr:hypothetical protein GSI_04115 [Ganoderma sinense ZZ0214-1]
MRGNDSTHAHATYLLWTLYLLSRQSCLKHITRTGAKVAHLEAHAMEKAQELELAASQDVSGLNCISMFTSYIFTHRFKAYSPSQDLSLPFSGRDWYTDNIYPVGPSLRAVDENRGFESDMRIPIFLSKGGFDNAGAIALPVGQETDFEALLASDLAWLAREQAAQPECSSSPCDVEQPKDVAGSCESGIFEPPEDFQDPEHIPLVRLWLDITADLKQRDISHPVDLYSTSEQFAITITSIIRRAYERNSELATLVEYIAYYSSSESYLSKILGTVGLEGQGEGALDL